MRKVLALALCALLSVFTTPAFAAPSLGGWSAKAGSPAYISISDPAGGPTGTFTFSTKDGTAKAGTDYTATTQTITIASTPFSARVAVPTQVNANQLGQTLHFGSVLSNAAGVTVSNAGSSITEPTVAPPPQFPGAASIASDFDPMLGLSKIAVNTLDNGVDPVGAFRFICGSSGVNYDDAIVFPNQPGRSHLHQYYGVEANASTTYEGLRTAKDGTIKSSCSGDPAANMDHVTNRSSYWMPAMLLGNQWVLQPNTVSIYYKRLPSSNPGCGPYVLGTGGTEYQNLQAAKANGGKGKCIPIPNGLKMIAGYDMVSTTAPTGHHYIGCITPGGHGTGIQGSTLVDVVNCPVGDQLDVRISMPDCTDGRLDSPNHRDHVSYMIADKWTAFTHCDIAHPFHMPTFTIAVIYPVTPEVVAALQELAREAAAGAPWDYTKIIHLSSDEMHPNLIPFETFHADFFEAHDPVEKFMWDSSPDGCIEHHLNCSGGDMGNGYRIKGAGIPYYNGKQSWTNPQPLIPIPPKPSASAVSPMSM